MASALPVGYRTGGPFSVSLEPRGAAPQALNSGAPANPLPPIVQQLVAILKAGQGASTPAFGAAPTDYDVLPTAMKLYTDMLTGKKIQGEIGNESAQTQARIKQIGAETGLASAQKGKVLLDTLEIKPLDAATLMDKYASAAAEKARAGESDASAHATNAKLPYEISNLQKVGTGNGKRVLPVKQFGIGSLSPSTARPTHPHAQPPTRTKRQGFSFGGQFVPTGNISQETYENWTTAKQRAYRQSKGLDY